MLKRKVGKSIGNSISLNRIVPKWYNPYLYVLCLILYVRFLLNHKDQNVSIEIKNSLWFVDSINKAMPE